MKKIFLVLIFLLPLVFNSAKSYEYWLREDWNLLPEIYVGGYPLQSAYCDFFFIDSLNGIMSRAGGHEANVFKTTDGGYSWNYVLKESIIWKDGKHEYVPGLATELDIDKGIAVLGTKNQTTVLETYSKDSGMVWISIDSGETWNKNYTGLKSGINGVRVLDNGTIIVMSKKYIGKSLDTGKTWTKSTHFPITIYDTTYIVNPIDSTKREIIWTPNILESIDANNIFVIAIRNRGEIKNKFIYSSDGGESWEYNEFPRHNTLSVTISPDNKLWAGGRYYRVNDEKAYMYVDYSTDNGDTWINSLDTVFAERWTLSVVSMIRFYDSLNGAVVGAFGHFMRTTDGGKSWHDEVRKGKKPDTLIYGSWSNFAYKTKDTIVLYDHGNMLDARLIMAPLLPIPTGVENVSTTKSDYYIYPNPASDFIEVNFKLSNDIGAILNASEKVRIFDILGIEVAQSSLIDGINRINISHLPTGVYFIKVGSTYDKFIKQK